MATVASDPLSLVEKKFCLPHWVFMREFRDNTGFNSQRSADALAIGIYSSRGQLIMGFEQKVSRADWLRELRNAEKADRICRYCDHWNIVVPDREIVRMEEVPPNWGLILAVGQRLKTLKPAPQLQPVAPDRGFLAALIKRAMDEATAPFRISDEQKLVDAEKEGFERGQKVCGREIERFRVLQEQVNIFEKASGVQISQYCDARKIGSAVRAVMNHQDQIGRARGDVKRAIANLHTLMQALQQCLQDLPEETKTADYAAASL